MKQTVYAVVALAAVFLAAWEGMSEEEKAELLEALRERE